MHLVLYILQSSPPQEFRKPSPNVDVAATGSKRGMKCLEQRIPRRVWRLAEPRCVVDFLDCDCTSRTHQIDDFREKCLRGGNIDHDKPFMSEVKGLLLQAACQDICFQHRDIAKVTLSNLVSCHVREARLSLEAHDDPI